MRRIQRAYRLPADLVERFDRAAEKVGVDKTLVIECAIVDFCERVESGEKPTFRKETKRMKDIRKFEHADRVEYYSSSLFDIAEVIDQADREAFIESGKEEFDSTVRVYGVKEFMVIKYNNGVVTGSLISGNEVEKMFFRKHYN